MMCKVDMIEQYEQEIKDYLEFVNTELYHVDIELCAAYGAALGLSVSRLPEWELDAEASYIGDEPEEWVYWKYGDAASHLHVDILAELIDKELQDGFIFESGGFWFESPQA